MTKKSTEREPIEFKYNYHKLHLEEFLTVRGASRAKQYKVGEIVGLKKKGEPWGRATIIAISTVAINQMKIEQMKHIAEHGKLTILAQHQFVDFLNELREPPKKKITSPYDKVAVFHLRKYRGES